MKTTAAAVQWMAFMMASSLVAPIALAAVFGLDGPEAAGFVQRTIFVLGAATLIQVFFGHRLPVNEGPAGLWWGVFALYAGMGTTMFSSSLETLQALQGALIASGILFILLSAAGMIEKISRLFTPVVTGVYLLLLVMQLSKSFLNGMLGIGYTGQTVDLKITLLSLLTVLFTFYVTKHKIQAIRQYGVLIALAAGWVLFALAGAAKPLPELGSGSYIALPELLAFGAPSFEPGMLMTAGFVTLLLLTNMIASIRVVENVLEQQTKSKKKAGLRQSGLAAGVNQMLGGLFSAVGPVPISGSAGFISATGITARKPFIAGALLVTACSLSPWMMGFFAALPVPVGYAVTFVVFTNMIGIAFADFEREEHQERIRPVIGASLMSGIGIMFVPAEAFDGLPAVLVSLLNNGLIFGSLIAILADQWTRKIFKSRS